MSEKSQKQTEMLNAYKNDKTQESWPILRRLLRPEPLAKVPKITATPYNSPRIKIAD